MTWKGKSRGKLEVQQTNSPQDSVLPAFQLASSPEREVSH